MDNGKKNTPQVFTTNDIRKHARDWTLAGDVGLLAHLEQFSENIINKTQETQKHFSELVNDYEELYTKVGNVTNQFLALQNCQFVENRVYDEETPTEEKREVKVQDEAEQEKLMLLQYKEAVEIGVKLLDTHFQEIQLPPNSDSDDEDEVSAGNSIIWKPKNLYAGKKFPLLIGSAEWWADDHVGLRANEEVLDSDKIISESESEMESLKSVEKPPKSSSSSSIENMKSVPTKQAFLDSSEDLFGFDKNENMKVASDDISKGSNSLLEEPSNFLPFDKEPTTETKEKSESFGEDQNHEQIQKSHGQEAATRKPDKVDNDFTRELVAKLDSVTSKTKEKKEGAEVREGSTPKKSTAEENLFDETDDNSDLFSIQKVTEKLPEKKNLFFDAENDDELFRGKNDLFSGGILFESDALKDAENEPKERKSSESSVEPKTKERKDVIRDKKNLVNDLFDDLDDDGTLFAVRPVNNKATNQSFNPPPMEGDRVKAAKPNDGPGMFWDSDDGLFDSINTEIDHNFSNSSGLFVNNANKAGESKISANLKGKEKTSDLFAKEYQIDRKPEKVKEASDSDAQITKKPAAEDSFDDLFSFSSSTEQGDKKISILDSEDDDLFSKTLKEDKKPPIKILSLPEDEDYNDAALFGEKPKPPDSVSVSSSRSSLFDDVNASKSRLASVFEKDKSNKPEDDLFSGTDESLFASDAKLGKDLFAIRGKDKEKSSLFDDCDDDDDLFGTGRKDPGEKSSSENPPGDSPKDIEDIFDRNEKQDHAGKGFIENSEDEDLFKTTKPRETKSDILRRSDHKLFMDEIDDAGMFSDNSEASKPKPPNSLSLRATETEPKGKTVGKLNIPDNLKVRFESAAMNISQRGVKVSEESKKTEEETREEVLDESVQSSALLKCPSKDRVKIPGRRRPQSRRARQEAIRNSGTWDQTILPVSTSSAIQTPKDSLPSPVMSNPLSPSTDEEDFFKVPELDTNFEKEDQSIFKSDLFETSKMSKLDDSLLFDGAPVLSPPSPKKSSEPEKKEEEPARTQQKDSLFGSVKPKPTSLFSDEDDDLDENDDENLFKTPKPTLGEAVLPQTSPRTDGKVKKALFDSYLDDDDDDDLFGGTSRATPKLPAQDKPKNESEPKEKGNSSFVDPLGLMK